MPRKEKIICIALSAAAVLFFSNLLHFDSAVAQTLPGCSAPALYSPQGVSPDIGIAQTFRWEQNQAESIQLVVYPAIPFYGYPAFAKWYNASDICSGGTCIVTPTTILLPNDYVWWINTWSSACGMEYKPGDNSLPFTVQPCTTAPSLLSPTPATPGLTIHPTFSWSRTNVQGYQLQVYSAAVGKISFSKWYDPAAVCDATTCTVTPPGIFWPGSYSWWVNTWSNACSFQFAPSGATQSFTVPPCPNPGIVLIEPTGGIATTNATPTLTWQRSNTVDRYQVTVDVIPAGGAETIHLNQWFDAAAVCNATQCSVAVTNPLPKGAAVYWWLNTWTNSCGLIPQPSGNLGNFNVILSDAKDITSFVFRAADNPGLTADVPGTIGTNTIDLDVPFGTDLSFLVPTIAITGVSVSPASGSGHPFTNGVGATYTVSAEDGTFKDYTVTVHVAPDPNAKNITSFVFRTADNPGLASDVTGTIGAGTVALLVPYGTNLSSLIPTIAITGASISPASGMAHAFTNGVSTTYTVTAINGTTKAYAVMVITDMPSPEQVFNFDPAHTDLTYYGYTGVTNISYNPAGYLATSYPSNTLTAATFTTPAFLTMDRNIRGGIVMEWKIRWMEQWGGSYRERNKVKMSLLDSNGNVLYQVDINPVGHSNDRNMPDLFLNAGQALTQIGSKTNRYVYPIGDTAWVSFKLELDSTAVRLYEDLTADYTTTDGNPNWNVPATLKINVPNMIYNNVSKVQFEYTYQGKYNIHLKDLAIHYKN